MDPELRDGLLCVGGRLRHAPIEEEQRLPIRHYRLLSGHSGQEYVLSLIRKGYWIIKGRVAVTESLTNVLVADEDRHPLVLRGCRIFLSTELLLTNPHSVLWASIALVHSGSRELEVELNVTVCCLRAWSAEQYT